MRHSILFLSHGGGPLPLLGDPGHEEMVTGLRHVTTLIDKPSAILVISAHWEEPVATLTSAPQPELIYDYYGFPDESYQITYPCPGEPELASQVQDVLKKHGVTVNLDDKRGFDHGLFVPLKIMYPAADIPCIQLSLLKNLDAHEHIQMGKALADLDFPNLLIIGSGFSFHNMRAFFAKETEETKAMNIAFDTWLIETLSSDRLSEKDREKRLVNWEQAPHARYCHPREEHLLPLHVCYGVAQGTSRMHLGMQILNKQSSVFLW